MKNRPRQSPGGQHDIRVPLPAPAVRLLLASVLGLGALTTCCGDRQT